MSLVKSKRDDILDAAESMIRTVGYNAFSTRDVAAAVGIKASSVHYHFATKSDMGAAVALRYTLRFIEALGNPATFKNHPNKALALYVDAFRTALLQDDKLCLCVVLGAEIGGLPPEVAACAKEFFEQNLEWLIAALNHDGRDEEVAVLNRATLILASLEGAMVLSKTLGDPKVFERVVNGLVVAA